MTAYPSNMTSIHKSSFKSNAKPDEIGSVFAGFQKYLCQANRLMSCDYPTQRQSNFLINAACNSALLNRSARYTCGNFSKVVCKSSLKTVFVFASMGFAFGLRAKILQPSLVRTSCKNAFRHARWGRAFKRCLPFKFPVSLWTTAEATQIVCCVFSGLCF